jgi:hypothetical protein
MATVGQRHNTCERTRVSASVQYGGGGRKVRECDFSCGCVCMRGCTQAGSFGCIDEVHLLKLVSTNEIETPLANRKGKWNAAGRRVDDAHCVHMSDSSLYLLVAP